MNLQQDRSVPNHPLLQQYLPAATPSNSWGETHKTISQLDGLLCVDTAIALLGGLVGVPTLLVLNTPCDWRWGIAGTSSLWYPNQIIMRRRWKPIIENA